MPVEIWFPTVVFHEDIAFDLFALADLAAAQSGMPRIDAWERFP